MLSPLDIARRRFASQYLAEPTLRSPADVVGWLGAVQAQDYLAAKWGVAQRTAEPKDAAVEKALNAGTILRTHVLRPTWHFVRERDIRWMLALTAPRVIAASAYYLRKLELDDAVVRRSRTALTKALQGGKHLTRADVGATLRRARIEIGGPLRLGLLLMRAELDGVICSGARRGNQSTYALLEERVPPAAPLERDEALSQLAARYYTRGPATVHDFAWWSGLTVTDARRGTAAAARGLHKEFVDGREYWFTAGPQPAAGRPAQARLLPNYDETFVGFKDRRAFLERLKNTGAKLPDPALRAHVIGIDGQLVGGWRRTFEGKGVKVHLNVITRATAAEQRAISAEAARYGAFLALPVQLA